MEAIQGELEEREIIAENRRVQLQECIAAMEGVVEEIQSAIDIMQKIATQDKGRML